MRQAIGPLAAVAAIVVAVPAAAQESRVWQERIALTLDIPFQVIDNGFSEAVTSADTLRPTQTAQFNTAYGSTRGALLGIGTAARISARFGVGATVTLLNRNVDGSYSLTVPSLVAGNVPLSLNGTAPALDRREVDVHLQALYAFAAGPSLRVTVGGGPSIFNTSQDLVRAVQFDTLPGLGALQFDQAFVIRAKETTVGGNVGVDLSWSVKAHLGLGTFARYSRGNVTLDPGSASGVTRSVTLHAGGLDVGAGLRVRF
jgi:hypothetical protein